MSLLGKLLGRRSFDDERQAADEAFEAGHWGDAKLIYERARALLPEGFEKVGEEIDARLVECADRMARGRIAEADRLLTEGRIDEALEQLARAEATAASESLVREARERTQRAEQDDALERAADVDLPEADRLEAIAGSWEDDQRAEYGSYGPEFLEAVLATYTGEGKGVRGALEALVATAPAPRYLWLELARARLQDDDDAGGRDALQTFLHSLQPGEGGEARLVAHMELAALHHEAEQFEEAVAQYEAALEALPEDPRPYLAMGAFFRRQDLAEEAVEVLEAGLDVMGDARPDWRMLQELGLAHADLGHSGRAVELLEQVIDFLVTRQHLDLPPAAARRLAELYEADGRTARAIDLYSMLAGGSDGENHFVYHLEAGRLMLDMGLEDEARRMLVRAAALIGDDPEQRARLQSVQARLEPS